MAEHEGLSDLRRDELHHHPGEQRRDGILPMINEAAGFVAGAVGREISDAISGVESLLVPAWQRVTDGEARWPVSVAVAGAIAMQLSVPSRLTLGQSWILPAIEGSVLPGLTVLNPGRIRKLSPITRRLSMAVIALMTLGNTWSAAKLVRGLAKGTEGTSAMNLLLTGGAIWLTNVMVFALWYWEFDRGGPARRAMAKDPHPDFVFPQMQSPDLAGPNWIPTFVDYLYLSFTNATAFSPTDTLPFSRWAKLLMMAQSAVSLLTVGLVIARAVNILR